jgi:hypothetical protein
MAGSRSIPLLSLSKLKAEDSKRRDFVEFQPSILSPEQLPGLPVQDHPFGGQHLKENANPTSPIIIHDAHLVLIPVFSSSVDWMSIGPTI